MHCHDRRQVQKLLLSSGEFLHTLVEPLMNSKIARHLRNPELDCFVVISKALQPKSQFMPDFVCYDLIIRILHDKTDLLTLRPVIDFCKFLSLEQNGSARNSMRHKYALEMTEQSAFATAAPSTDHIQGSLLNLHIYLIEHLTGTIRVCKTKVMYLYYIHKIFPSCSSSS